MTDIRKAGALILADLAIFDEAGRLFARDIHPEVLENLDDVIKSWATENGWVGNFDSENSDTYVGPPNWRTTDIDSDEPSWIAWFWLTTRAEPDNSWLLADMCGVGTTETGFKYVIEYESKVGQKSWKAIVQTEMPDELITAGFVLDECRPKGFFLPFRIDAQLLSEAWASEDQDYESAFAPVLNALSKLRQSANILENMRLRAIQSSTCNEDGGSLNSTHAGPEMLSPRDINHQSNA